MCGSGSILLPVGRCLSSLRQGPSGCSTQLNPIQLGRGREEYLGTSAWGGAGEGWGRGEGAQCDTFYQSFLAQCIAFVADSRRPVVEQVIYGSRRAVSGTLSHSHSLVAEENSQIIPSLPLCSSS